MSVSVLESEGRKASHSKTETETTVAVAVAEGDLVPALELMSGMSGTNAHRLEVPLETPPTAITSQGRGL